jgi:7-cyano-7-deazaguanine reductase
LEKLISRLEVFPNPNPGRDYLIEHTCPEFTALCPKTGQPDFATLILRYVPDRKLKSLKMYLGGYRNEGIYYEAVTNKILDDLVKVTQPRSMMLEGRFGVRGGISSVVTASYEKAKKARR